MAPPCNYPVRQPTNLQGCDGQYTCRHLLHAVASPRATKHTLTTDNGISVRNLNMRKCKIESIATNAPDEG